MFAMSLWLMFGVVLTAQHSILKSNTIIFGDLLDADTGTDFAGVLYTRDGNIYYNHLRINGDWTGEFLLGTGNEGKLTVDANNNIHVAYTTSGKIGYRMFNGANWTDEVLIESLNIGGTGTCSKPDIGVDGTGVVHFTYTDSHGSNGDDYIYPDIMYAKSTGVGVTIQLIHRGYRDYSSAGSWAADYFSKGSCIAVTDIGDYYIMTHQHNIWRWPAGTDNNYSINISSNLGNGGISNYGTDIFTINDLYSDGSKVWALYRENSLKFSELTLSGSSFSFTNTQNITASSVSSFISDGFNKVVGGKSNNNLLTYLNNFSHVYSNIVVKGDKVSLIQMNDSFYAIYTDNSNNTIQMCEVVRPLSLTSFSLPGQTETAHINIKDGTINIKVPQGTSLVGLVPSFAATTDVESIKIEGIDQISGVTTVDFTNPVTYIINGGGESRNWVVSVTFDVTSATNEGLQTLVRLHPNPFHEKVYISNPELVKSVEVKNLMGQTLLEFKTEKMHSIYVDGLKKGIYLFVVELINGDKIVEKMQKY